MIVYDIFWGFSSSLWFSSSWSFFQTVSPQFQNGLNLLNNYYVNTTRTWCLSDLIFHCLLRPTSDHWTRWPCHRIFSFAVSCAWTIYMAHPLTIFMVVLYLAIISGTSSLTTLPTISVLPHQSFFCFLWFIFFYPQPLFSNILKSLFIFISFVISYRV